MPDQRRRELSATVTMQPMPLAGLADAPETATFWVDAQTFLLLKSEERSSKGILRYEVTRVDYDVDVPGALFSTPPQRALWSSRGCRI